MSRRVLPSGLTLDSIRRAYERELRKREDGLIETLENLLAREIEPGVASATVTVWPDFEDGGRVDVTIQLDGPDKRLDRHDDALFPGRHLRPFGDLELPLLSDAAEREDGDDPVCEAIAEWVAHAVARAWWKAGGWRYPVAVVLEVGEPGDGIVIALSRAGRERIGA